MMDAVGRYLDQIGRIPLLDAGGERRLGREIAEGRAAAGRIAAAAEEAGDGEAVAVGEEARSALTLANLRLVVSIARGYPRPVGVDLSDLIQAGNDGLQRAVDRYDWRLGFRFSTYATRWIRQAIGRAVDRSWSSGQIPMERAQELRSALRHAAEEAAPLPAHLAAADAASRTTSLDVPAAEASTPLGALLADRSADVEELVLRSELSRAVVSLVDDLPADGRRAVSLRFGLDGGHPRSYREIAASLGTRVETVPPLMRQSMERLRRGAGALPQ